MRTYTIIIAEDEEPIRRAIVRKVDWEKIGFEVIAEAQNGADALEMTERLKPDLLLTDIRMPFLSGIELAREIREVAPGVQIAFLTGFDDFSYAQQAITYNIVSYMLKPISAGELTEKLIQIREKLDEKYESFARLSYADRVMEKAEFLMPLLLGGDRADEVYESEMEQMAQKLGLISEKTDVSGCFCIMVTTVKRDGKTVGTPAMKETVDRIIGKYMRFVSCYMSGKVISILYGSERNFSKYLHIMTAELPDGVKKLEGYSCRIGVSRLFDRLSDARDGYLDALHALSYAAPDVGEVSFISDEERGSFVRTEDVSRLTEPLAGMLRGGTERELEAYGERIRTSLLESRSRVYFAELTARLWHIVHKTVYMAVGEQEADELERQFVLPGAFSESDVAETIERFGGLCARARQLIVGNRKKSADTICERALRIIDTRYEQQELSVLSVSSEVGVSPNYLSSIIKKQTGETFVELLTKRRISRAKELLLTTPMKIRDITEACGYNDQYYFSHCFKKQTGFSPNAMRKEYEKHL